MLTVLTVRYIEEGIIASFLSERESLFPFFIKTIKWNYVQSQKGIPGGSKLHSKEAKGILRNYCGFPSIDKKKMAMHLNFSPLYKNKSKYPGQEALPSCTSDITWRYKSFDPL